MILVFLVCTIRADRRCLQGTLTPRSSLAQAFTPKVVSERLGHSTIAITLDTYSHAISALQEAAAEKVAAMVFGPR